MNEEHIIEEHIVAAILASGLINQDRGDAVALNPADAIELYEQCRVALAQSEHKMTTEVRL